MNRPNHTALGRQGYASHTSFGRLGEDLALKYLTGKGYSLIARNYHIYGGEIDLILQKNGILIFAEVKTRRSHTFGAAEEAISWHKKQKLLRAIKTYLFSQKNYRKWRCDLLAIQFMSPREAQIRHYQDIFAE